LLFVPASKNGNDPTLDATPYRCRRTSPPDSPRILADWVTVEADGFGLVDVRGPARDDAAGGVDIPVRDQIDFSPYGIEEAPALGYGPLDAFVDRYALADLTNRLVALLPHYYFFVLPLSIGDALHAAGDFEGAKKHFDVIYDLFPNEVERRDRTI